jgi:hypothetical protein
MDAVSPDTLSVLALAVWVWQRRGDHGDDPPEHLRS